MPEFIQWVQELPAELMAGIAYFVFVFFKAFQQRNVAFMHYHWVMPISYVMSLSEVFIISVVAIRAASGAPFWEMVRIGVAIGTGGGLGAICAMWLHHKYLGGGD